MSNPIVLHLIFDAIAPDNTFTLIDFLSKSYLSADKYPHHKRYSTLDHRGKMLLSPQMWCRAYTRHELSYWGAKGEVERWDPNQIDSQESQSKIRYLNIDRSKMIWNILAKNHINSFVFPYYSYAQYGRRIFTDSNPEYVNGILRTFENNYYDELIRGEFWRKSSDHKYWGMHETPERWYHDNPERLKEIRSIWDNSSDEDLKRLIPEILDEESKYIIPTYLSNIEDNKHIMHEEIIPSLSRVDYSNGGYAHIGFIETDSWMHFSEPYSELIEAENDYIDGVLKEILRTIDPDIIIIHGDHGQDRIRDKHRQKLWCDIEYRGTPHRAARAKWVPCVMFNDHSHYVGGHVFTKDKKYLDKFDEYFNSGLGTKTDDHDYLMMDTVYDFITHESEQGGILNG